MKIIGITGGIGSGKSTVSEFLRKEGWPIVDADEISHRITEKGSPALDVIRAAFGDEVFTADGALDRPAMAKIVFADPEKNKLLRSIVTKQVYYEAKDELEKLAESGKYSLAFLDVPLLYETHSETMCDYVWYVTADREIRIRRVASRDGITREEVEARMKAQMSDQEKAEKSDEVIDNSGDLDDLRSKITGLLARYQVLVNK